MNVSSSLRLKPLAACLAAALAIVPACPLFAEPARPEPRPQHALQAVKRSHVAQFLATSTGLTHKGLSLQQVMGGGRGAGTRGTAGAAGPSGRCHAGHELR